MFLSHGCANEAECDGYVSISTGERYVVQQISAAWGVGGIRAPLGRGPRTDGAGATGPNMEVIDTR